MYPFDNLDEFDKIRALAVQDLAAATLQIKLRTSSTARTVVRIYYGPPGTGKTLTAVREAVRLADPAFAEVGDFAACFRRFAELTDQVAFVTFHQSLQYEDVVESIRPVLAREATDVDEETNATSDDAGATRVGYAIYEGPFMRLRRKAAEQADKDFVVVIDEINRGDISRILGPLISSIEADKRVGAPFPIGFEAQYPVTDLESRVFLPANLHIIGTMNSADRNIALVDYALRRRFDFVEIPPQPELLPEVTAGADPINVRKLLTVLNSRIAYLLDADHCIGHGYFAKVTSNEDLVEVLARKVIPLLREYFYGNEASLLMVLRDVESGVYNIHQIKRSDTRFEEIFGLTRDAFPTDSRRHSPRDVVLSFDPRFWDPNLLVPAPRDLAYAIKAVRKIYGDLEPTALATPQTTAQPVGAPPEEDASGA